MDLNYQTYPKSQPGNNLLTLDEKVGVLLTIDGQQHLFTGYVAIIDKYGTMEQSEEPSYDIYVEKYINDKPCLIKHCRQSSLYDVT